MTDPTITLSVHQSLGRRQIQQDRYVACPVRDGVLLGVFDGHGPLGDRVAERAALAAPRLLCDALAERLSPAAALRRVIAELVRLCSDGGTDALDPDSHLGAGGSTATLAYVARGVATVAVLGDSPALCATDEAVLVAPEHCVKDDTVALERLKTLPDSVRAGLVVQFGYLNRRWSQLALTRALGDPDFADVLYLEPDIREYPLAAGDVLVLASDAIRVNDDPETKLEVYRDLATQARHQSANELAERFIARFNPSDNFTLLVCQAQAAAKPKRVAASLW